MLAFEATWIATKVPRGRNDASALLTQPPLASHRCPERRHAARRPRSWYQRMPPWPPDIRPVLSNGNLATHQSTATSLFPSHPGKSPTSPQQFAAIGTLVSQL